MKTNMGKVFTTLLCMMMCLSLYAQEFTLGMVVGSWNFSAPDAPYGYQKGTCQIKKTGENRCFHDQRYGNDREGNQERERYL